MFLVDLALELTRRSDGFRFKADMEFPVVLDKVKPGTKPASDGGICAIICSDDGSNNTGYRPVVLLEYKPVVDIRENFVKPDDLVEVAIQGFFLVNH